MHFSFNAETGKDKVRFLVGQPGALVPNQANCSTSLLIPSAIDIVSFASLGNIVVDRGHKFLDGSVEACFWIHRVRSVRAGAGHCQPSATDQLPASLPLTVMTAADVCDDDHDDEPGDFSGPSPLAPCSLDLAVEAGSLLDTIVAMETPVFGCSPDPVAELENIEQNSIDCEPLDSMQEEMNAIRQMLEPNVTAGVPDFISGEFVKLLGLIAAARASHPQLSSQHGLSDRISAMEEKPAAKFTGSQEVVILQLQTHCAEIFDLRVDLMLVFQPAVDALRASPCPGSIDVNASAVAASPIPVPTSAAQPEQRHQSSIPRDIHRTDRLAAPNKTKAKKR